MRRPPLTPEVQSPHALAADWMLRAEVGLAPEEAAQLERWLETDPSHQAAWRDVHFATEAAVAAAGREEVVAMRTAALAARPDRTGLWPAALAACVAVCVIVAGFTFRSEPPGPADAAPAAASAQATAATYATAVGERLIFSLPDGSSVALDTDSRVEIAYTSGERGVRLLRGQALFDVAKGKPHPFRVYAGDRRITAVGTRFNVRLDRTGEAIRVRVTLLEGVVKVSAEAPSPAAPTPPVTLAAGELLETAASGSMRVVAVDAERVASWRSGVLVFSDEPLATVVAEMNRYSAAPIRVGEEAGALRVSGVFRTSDRSRFVSTISEVFPLQVIEEADGSLALEPRNMTPE